MEERPNGGSPAAAACVAALAVALAAGCGDGRSDLLEPGVSGQDDEPVSIRKVGGDDQTGAPGERLGEPYVVSVHDAQGDPVAGVDVVFSVRSGDGGSLSATSVATDGDGEAAVTATLPDRPDATQAVDVTADSVEETVRFTSTTTSVSGRAENLSLVSGDGQKGMIRRVLSDPLRVEVTDSAGVVVAGHPVRWRVVSADGGSVADDTVRTGDRGAAATDWRLGVTPGAVDSVIAWIEPSEAEPDTVTFTADVTGTPDSIHVLQGAIELDHNATPEPDSLVGDTVTVAPEHWARDAFHAVVLDGDGRTVHGAELRWTVTDGLGAVGDVPDGDGGEAVLVDTAEDGSVTVWRKAPEETEENPIVGEWIGATLSLEAFPDVDPVTLDALGRD